SAKHTAMTRIDLRHQAIAPLPHCLSVQSIPSTRKGPSELWASLAFEAHLPHIWRHAANQIPFEKARRAHGRRHGRVRGADRAVGAASSDAAGEIRGWQAAEDRFRLCPEG